MNQGQGSETQHGKAKSGTPRPDTDAGTPEPYRGEMPRGLGPPSAHREKVQQAVLYSEGQGEIRSESAYHRAIKERDEACEVVKQQDRQIEDMNADIARLQKQMYGAADLLAEIILGFREDGTIYHPYWHTLRSKDWRDRARAFIGRLQ